MLRQWFVIRCLTGFIGLIQPLKILIAVVILVFAFSTIIPIEHDAVVEELKVAKIVDPKQLNCLAKNIFYDLILIDYFRATFKSVVFCLLF